MGKGFFSVGLDNPKNAINVGAVLRAASAYGGASVVVGAKNKRFRFRGMLTDTTGAAKQIPVYRTEDLLTCVPYGCVPVAVELSDRATSLPAYQHPERAYYIFGAEDATLGKRVLDRCRDVIQVPTNHCLNLAATVNVVLYDRLCKQLAAQWRSDAERFNTICDQDSVERQQREASLAGQ